MTIDPATIAAFVDGELDDLAARRVERAAEGDPAIAAEIARHRRLKAQLAAHFAPILDETIPDQLSAILARPAPVDMGLAARREAKRPRFGAVHWGAMAAALLLGLMVGMRPWAPAGPVAVEGGTLIAAGPLDTALDTQLASSKNSDAPVRIGLTFRDRSGRLCRSFESAIVGGIGCRTQDRWQIETTVRGHESGEYRQASSGQLAAAATAIMAGEPLDAADERRARANGWR